MQVYWFISSDGTVDLGDQGQFPFGKVDIVLPKKSIYKLKFVQVMELFVTCQDRGFLDCSVLPSRTEI